MFVGRRNRTGPLVVTRRGTTLIEVTVALLVLSAAMLALVQMLSLATQQRRLTEVRRIALEEVANQAERVAALPWDRVTADKLTNWEPSAALLTAIPHAKCQIAVSDEAGLPAARRVHLEIAWTGADGQPALPVGLTVWKFAEGRP
jgi:Tfp pilus assembly protein PilV